MGFLLDAAALWRLTRASLQKDAALNARAFRMKSAGLSEDTQPWAELAVLWFIPKVWRSGLVQASGVSE